MLYQNASLFKFAFFLGNKQTTGNISLTIEATSSILVLVVKWHRRANGLFKEFKERMEIGKATKRSMALGERAKKKRGC